MNNPMDFNGSFTESVGLETGAVPTSIYTDAAQYEVERERIFRRAWLMVGRVERIPKPGDFFVKQLAVLNASVIVARSEDGTIRAFHNVCAHRANIVEHRASGNAKRFVCRYHSWGYDNAGQLAHVPDESGFFGLDKKKCGLTPVALEIWEGWIFINLATEPELSLAEFLGPIADALTGIEYQNPDHPIVLRGEFNANWKAVAENFSEAYHVASIHPKTLAPFYIGQQNPFGRPISVRLHGPHRSMSWWLNPDRAAIREIEGRAMAVLGRPFGDGHPQGGAGQLDRRAQGREPDEARALGERRQLVLPELAPADLGQSVLDARVLADVGVDDRLGGALLLQEGDDGPRAPAARAFHVPHHRFDARGPGQHREHAGRYGVRGEAGHLLQRERGPVPSRDRAGRQVVGGADGEGRARLTGAAADLVDRANGNGSGGRRGGRRARGVASSADRLPESIVNRSRKNSARWRAGSAPKAVVTNRAGRARARARSSGRRHDEWGGRANSPRGGET